MIRDILVRLYVEICVVKFEAYVWLTRRQKLYFVEVFGF